MATSAESTTDGRFQRSERSREAIVQAMIGLIGEGRIAPTAQEVAERAQVGVRTVFRHFSDMDTLFATMNDRLIEEVRAFFVSEVQRGPLEVRVDALLRARFEMLERMAPYLRSAQRQRAASTFLKRQHDRNVREFRSDLMRRLPELEEADPSIADGLELALSFEAWDRLRSDQRLGVQRTRDALGRIASSLIATLKASP